MAGRGRGGKSSSLTQEQLQTLGCIGKDGPQVQTAPPPTFPPLMTKPVKQETTAAQNYQILWKEDFLNHMRDSPYYLTTRLDTKSASARHVSERFANAVENTKTRTKADFHWKLMPSELQAPQKKRRGATVAKVGTKKAKTENIEDRLKVLEEKERNEKDPDANVKRGSDSENDEEEEEELAADEEMDDENDYGNSYFDNGEAYNEEDDNFDDGPVY